MKKVPFALGSLIIIFGFFLALAEDFQTFDALLRQMDRNHDNRISRSEWKGKAELFAIYDKDGNGVLLRNEYETTMKDYQAAYDQGFDEFRTMLRGDPDHPIPAGSYPGYANPYTAEQVPFSELDKNGDGTLTAEEFASWFAYETLKAMRGLTSQPTEPGDQLSFDALLRLMDRDHNNRISRSEWKGSAELFDIYDDDDNGNIIRSEYERVMKDYQAAYDQGFDEFRTMLRGDAEHPIPAGSYPGYANPYTHDPVPFNELDKNGDGILTAEEFASWFAYETMKAMPHH